MSLVITITKVCVAYLRDASALLGRIGLNETCISNEVVGFWRLVPKSKDSGPVVEHLLSQQFAVS